MSTEYKDKYRLPLHHIQDLEHVSLGLKHRVLDLLEKELENAKLKQRLTDLHTIKLTYKWNDVEFDYVPSDDSVMEFVEREYKEQATDYFENEAMEDYRERNEE